MTGFGNNDIRIYINMEQEYANWNEKEKFIHKYLVYISFVFKYKYDRDIPLIIESLKTFKRFYPNILYCAYKSKK